ncbi:MAG: DUF2480 family protein [Bacteroidetes bacterium]|nr:DUF2480 family protein [Bacteroidota bacterium]MCY4232246.1 DUF2480 family protein [Bacteroidota bacterium]
MEVVNRVAQSGIEVYDLELLWQDPEILELDIAEFLEQGIILREKPFRSQIETYHWNVFTSKHVAIYCSSDALIPMWAYMLIGAHLQGATSITEGRRQDVVREVFMEAIANEDWSKYTDRVVVVKGCGSGIVPASAYAKVIGELQKVARKVMFGEPCSSVPIWRKPKKV